MNRILLWFAFLLILQALDVGLTAYALTTAVAEEFNPLALFLWESFGVLGLAIPKALGTVAIALMMVGVVKTWPRGARVGKRLTLGVMALVVLNNSLVVGLA